MVKSRVLSGPVAPSLGRTDGQVSMSQAKAIVQYEAVSKHVFELLPGLSSRTSFTVCPRGQVT